MIQQFSPITLGARLKSIDAAGFVLTETSHAPDHELPRHRHELTNICFVLAGSYTEIVNRRMIECGPQSLLIKPPGEAHANRYGHRGMRSLLIEMQRNQLDVFRSCAGALDQVRHARGGLLSMLGMRIYKEFLLMDGASTLAIEGLMLELVANISRYPDTSKHSYPGWLKRAKEIFDSSFHESLSLARVANAVDVHPVTLARAFRRHIGCTPGEYIRHLRIAFACGELAGSGRPLVDIALAAGFAHQSHFSRVFKAHTGMTPAEFRSARRSC